MFWKTVHTRIHCWWSIFERKCKQSYVYCKRCCHSRVILVICKNGNCIMNNMYSLHYRQITEVLNDSNLTQTVSIPTRDSNILDLFFTTNPTLVQRVSIIQGISDHGIVQIQVTTSAKIHFQKPRSISLYKKANWDGMKQALEAYHLDMLESGKYSSLNAVQLQSCT